MSLYFYQGFFFLLRFGVTLKEMAYIFLIRNTLSTIPYHTMSSLISGYKYLFVDKHLIFDKYLIVNKYLIATLCVLEKPHGFGFMKPHGAASTPSMLPRLLHILWAQPMLCAILALDSYSNNVRLPLELLKCFIVTFHHKIYSSI